MKCHRCGITSDVEQAFSNEKNLFGEPRHFCPDCTVKRQTGSFSLMIALFFGYALIAFALGLSTTGAVVILKASLVILSSIPLIIIHELAHAGVAKLTGLRVFGILIGIGKTIWTGKFIGMTWVINILPVSAITFVGARPVPNIRRKLFFVYLAGPASHAVMAFLFYLLAQNTSSATLGHWLSIALVVENILLLIVNLFPRKVSVATGMQGTDGWNLVRVPFLKESELTERHVGYFTGEATEAYAANDFDTARTWVNKALSLDANSVIARNVMGIIQMARGEHRDSRETFLRLLEVNDDKQPGFRYILLNNIAYLDIFLKDSALLPEADQFSAEALKHLPWFPAIMGTRGTVLVELGNLDEGIVLLKKAMSSHVDAQGKAINACHLAVAEFRRGDLNAARKYLNSARTLDSKCFLLPSVEAQIADAAPKIPLVV